MPRRLGILGGTFNPPHRGHLAVASRARSQLGLERVLLMPSHTPPHKQPRHDPGPAHRLRMCELAVEGQAGLEAGALEIERGGPSFTVDTLLALHAPYASSHSVPRLTLILGSDMARTLPSWRRAGEIVGLADIAVAERPGDGRGDGREDGRGDGREDGRGDGREEVLVALESLGARVAFLEMLPIDVSSSMVRARVARGEDVRELVGPAVAAYIAEHELYRQPSNPQPTEAAAP